MLLPLIGQSRATTIGYPKASPVFVLNVPEGWSAEEDDSRPERVLSFTPKDGKLSCSIYLLPLTERGSEDLAAVTQRIATATLRNNERITDIRYADAATHPASAGGMAVARINVTCKIEGAASIFVFAVFNPIGNQLYEAVLCNPTTMKEPGANALNAILRSIKPADGARY